MTSRARTMISGSSAKGGGTILLLPGLKVRGCAYKLGTVKLSAMCAGTIPCVCGSSHDSGCMVA